ncbi:retinol dehydrogenase [Xenorhabdus hominickii]|uniref:Retinol dehydrogenase n=1 Tax=Xenorhabdus hominickii TaxID=351679 RepID=A0A2G0Q0A9_XENHO|nr:retinol dehydrogenase [Xenorhabdus hominickii]
MVQQISEALNTCKSILITGASTGLGARTACYLASRGFTVFAGIRDIGSVKPDSTSNIFQRNSTCRNSDSKCTFS